MAERDEPRFIPRYHSDKRFGTVPRWYTRGAAKIFDLNPSDSMVFYQIADNLNEHGVSKTSNTLIRDRGNLSLSTVKIAVRKLVAYGLIIELDEKVSGAIMRYAIPRDRPLTAKECGI